MKRHGIKRKGSSHADLAALVAPIMREAPEWAEAVRALFQGDRLPLAGLFGSLRPIPSSVRPVLERLTRGEPLRLGGRPPAHNFEVEARAWHMTMAQRELGMTAKEAEAIAARELVLTAGQVAGIVESFVDAGFTFEVWRESQPTESLEVNALVRRRLEEERRKLH